MLAPMAVPATSSVRVSPAMTLRNTSSPIRPAVTKRRPTKNSGPLCCMARWTTRKVPPQTMVTAIRASSCRLSSGVREL